MDIKNPQVYINDVLKEVNKIAVWYEAKKIYDFENFNKLSNAASWLTWLKHKRKKSPSLDPKSKDYA